MNLSYPGQWPHTPMAVSKEQLVQVLPMNPAGQDLGNLPGVDQEKKRHYSQGEVPKLLLHASPLLEEDKQIHAAFLSVSGYHTLTDALEWLKHVDSNQAWRSTSFPSWIPGRTHLFFLMALYVGPAKHKQQIMDLYAQQSVISALFLSWTGANMLNPPEFILEDPEILREKGLDWVPRWYGLSMALSVGLHLALALLGIYAQVLGISVVREADWLRIMFKRGDFVLLMKGYFFGVSIYSMVPAGYAIWYDNGFTETTWEGGLTLVFIFVPLIFLAAFSLIFLSFHGDIATYWLRTGPVAGYWGDSSDLIDMPDIDGLIEVFEAKVNLAQKILTADQDLARRRNRQRQQRAGAMSGTSGT